MEIKKTFWKICLNELDANKSSLDEKLDKKTITV